MPGITAHEHALKEVFSNSFAFRIPPYQRPYSWEIEHAGALLNDLLDASAAFSKMTKSKDVTPYFLGSVVAVKEDAQQADAEVIDGQQRLTTLSLLFAALRSFVSGDDEASLTGRLMERGDPYVGTVDRPRVTLRVSDHAFFEKTVLQDRTLSGLAQAANADLFEPQRKLVANSLYFVAELGKLTSDRRDALTRFLVQHTYLVVVTTPSVDSAFRIFSVLNDRGLDLTVADILKADIIGKIPEPAQSTFNTDWENAENALGPREFANLFSHIRMIHARAKLRKTVLEEFRISVTSAADPTQFMTQELLPTADSYREILLSDFKSSNAALDKRINHRLRLLHRMGDRDWVPPALLYLHCHRSDPARVADFLDDLERLAAALWIQRRDVNERIERYAGLMNAIDAGVNLRSDDSPLQLSAEERHTVTTALNGNIYDLSPKPKRTMILLRLDEALQSEEATYDASRITVEHVLPQDPVRGGLWESWWPEPAHRVANVHRLGNLALLNQRQNSAARNWEFDKKKQKYFKTKGGATPFCITNEVLTKPEWTPAIFEDRQARFVGKLKEVWRLG